MALADGTEAAPAKRGVGLNISRQARRIVAPLATFVALLIAWEVIARSTHSLIPTIEQILRALFEDPGFWWKHVSYTVGNALIGLVIGVLMAELLAIGITHSRALRDALMPLAIVIHATPVLAISPALVVVFGFGSLPHIVIVVLIVFFPMLMNAIAGFNAAPKSLLDVMAAMAASRTDVFLRLRFPASLPYQFAGLKSAATYSIIGAVVSEFSGSTRGLGATIMSATSYLNLGQLWGSIVLCAVTSLILLGIVALVERAVVRW